MTYAAQAQAQARTATRVMRPAPRHLAPVPTPRPTRAELFEEFLRDLAAGRCGPSFSAWLES